MRLMATIEHWKDILLEASRQNFASSKQGIILAKVPSILYNSGIEKEEILSGGRKLRELLASEAQTHLRLIQNEDSPLDWAVLPADLSISEPYSKYFPQPKTTDESVAPRRFISAFWQAFTRHIPNGHRRWLTRSPRLSFEDRIGGTPRADEIEIERKVWSIFCFLQQQKKKKLKKEKKLKLKL